MSMQVFYTRLCAPEATIDQPLRRLARLTRLSLAQIRLATSEVAWDIWA